MATTLDNDLHGIGAGWIFSADGVDGDRRNHADLKRIVDACEELIAELERRGKPPQSAGKETERE
jgi:hypothetical protein